MKSAIGLWPRPMTYSGAMVKIKIGLITLWIIHLNRGCNQKVCFAIQISVSIARCCLKYCATKKLTHTTHIGQSRLLNTM